MNKERAENDYGSHTALAPSNENYYSTIRQGKDFLNITALSMSSSSRYDTGDKSWSRFIDVLERSTPSKSSRKMKCDVDDNSNIDVTSLFGVHSIYLLHC